MTQEVELFNTINFIKQINKLGLQLSCSNGDLLVNAPADFVMDEQLIEKIRAHKQSIITYLSASVYNIVENDNHINRNSLTLNNQIYHLITPIERYWMNSEIDSEYVENKPTSAFNYLLFDVEGNLDAGAFADAIKHLLNRHESLNATFHKIEDTFYMRINDSPDIADLFEYRDFASIGKSTGDQLQSFINFKDHTFYFEKGPLISFRIGKIEGNKFVVGIKIHHIIFDNWSRDIIIRDVFVFYNNNVKDLKLELPRLNYQLKDYLALSNIHQENKKSEEKEYWLSKYPELPGLLTIPNTKKAFTPLSEKICRIKVIKLPKQTIEKIDDLSASYNESRFTILQAYFLAYISKITSQNDLVLGSNVFGRDFFDVGDLIGCFAKTVLIRVLLDKTDSLKTIVNKVRTANNEMRSRIAYPLIKVMEDMLPLNEKIYGKFWKLNFHYIELKGGLMENELVKAALNYTNLKLSARKEAEHEYLIPIDMQLTFLVNDYRISLEVQYDSSLYHEDVIEKMMTEYLNSF